MRHLLDWWPWLTGAAAVLVAGGLLFRRSLRFYFRVAKALTRDERLPRPLRWTVGIGLAAKALPVDFGIDEVALGVAALLLATRYRPVFRAVVAELRAESGALEA